MVDQTKISGFAAASRQWTVNEQNILRNLPTNEATMIPWRAGIAAMPAQATQTAPTSIFTAPTPAPVVTTPAVVTTAVAQAPIQQSTSRVEGLYSVVYNKETGKYDIVKGNKTIKEGIRSKSLAKKFVEKKFKKANADITASLRQSAPLGDVTKQGNPVTTPAVTAKPVATTPVAPKSATQTAKAVSKLGKAHAQPAKAPVTFASFAKEHGVDLRKAAENTNDIAAKNHAYKKAVEKHLAKPTNFSPENLERFADVNTKVPTAAQHSQRLQDLEATFGKVDDVKPNTIISKFDDIKPKSIIDNVDDVKPNTFISKFDDIKPKSIIDNADDVQKVTKNFDWKKLGKYAGIAAVAGLLVGAGILIGKAIQKNKAEKAEDVEPTPVVPVPVPENEEENVTPVEPTPAPVEPTPAPVDPFLPLNPDGTYTTKKGDCFWKIAERNLKDKFRNEPEKFENLPKKERDAKIQLETRRIMKLNGYTMAEDKWHSAPTLYPNVNIKINETIDVAA